MGEKALMETALGASQASGGRRRSSLFRARRRDSKSNALRGERLAFR